MAKTSTVSTPLEVPEEEWVSTIVAARLLQVSTTTIYNYVKVDRLKPFHVGGKTSLFFRKSDILALAIPRPAQMKGKKK